MPEEESTQVSKDDIERVSSKLESMMDELPEQERNVLGLILTRAATAAESEVEGFSFSPAVSSGQFAKPFAGQLAQSAGFGRMLGGTITVSWGYHHAI
jgi:hypothetical protein